MSQLRVLPATLAVIIAVGLTAGTVTAQSDGQLRPPIASEACAAVPADAEMTRSMDAGGATRGLRTSVPTTYDGLTPLPLIIWLHGQGMSASALEDVTDLPAFADANDIVVVAPEGHQPDSGWMWEPGAGGVEPGLENRDVAFIDALIDTLGSELCLDLARVYATGYSIGGHGATTLACRLSERIAAVVATAGFTDLGDACDATRTVPMLMLAGTADEYILFEGGLGDFLGDSLPWGTTKGEEPFFNRQDWSMAPIERAEAIAVRQGCQPGAASERIAAGLERLSWSCPAGADVALLVADGGEHDWQIEVEDVDANELYWSFLRRFALPE